MQLTHKLITVFIQHTYHTIDQRLLQVSDMLTVNDVFSVLAQLLITQLAISNFVLSLIAYDVARKVHV